MNIKDIFSHQKIWPAVGLIVIFGVVVAFALNLKHGYDDKLANAAADSQNLAFTVEHHAAATIQKTDLVLNRLVDEFSPGHGGKGLNTQRISNYLLTLRLKQPELKSLRIAKADGHVLYTLYTLMDGGGVVAPLSLGEDTFFTAHRDNPNLGLTLYEPTQGHLDPGRNLILSRRLNNPDGSFAGIAAATISLTYFESFYSSLNLDKNGSLTLLNDKLAILARFPAGDRFHGKSLAGSPLEAHLRTNPRGGTYSGASQVDGVERISSFRQVGDLPLYVNAGLAKQDFLAEWRRNTLIDSAVMVVLIAAILFLSYGRLRRPSAGQEEVLCDITEFRDEADDVRGAATVASDVTERHRSERLLEFENNLLEIACGNASLNATLDLLCRGMEEILDESLCAIMLLDHDGLHLRHGAAPSLPNNYNQAIDGIAISPTTGSCSTAAHTGQQVVTTDIAHDPLWANYKELALSHNLAACCSTPIYSEKDDLLGIITIYYRTPYQPTSFDLQADSRAAHLAGIAIQRKRADERLKHLNEILQQRAVEAMAKIEDSRAEHLASIALLRKRADESLNQLKKDMEQRFAADAATKIEGSRAKHLASIALLRKRADESLNQLKKVMGQRVADEVAKAMELEHKFMQHSRLAVTNEIIGDIAHQWRQPLNALDLMLANIKDAQKFHELDQQMLVQSTIEGRQIIHQMFSAIDNFCKLFKPDTEKVAFSLNNGIKGAVEILAASLRDYNIKTQVETEEEVIAFGFPNTYSQVLLNILNNAKDALVANNTINGVIHIRVACVGERACIIVRDNAGGMPADILANIFQPDFTTKHKGTGIGLYMSKIIIEDSMDGKIEARNVEGGTAFVLACPVAK